MLSGSVLLVVDASTVNLSQPVIRRLNLILGSPIIDDNVFMLHAEVQMPMPSTTSEQVWIFQPEGMKKNSRSAPRLCQTPSLVQFLSPAVAVSYIMKCAGAHTLIKQWNTTPIKAYLPSSAACGFACKPRVQAAIRVINTKLIMDR